MTDVVKNLLETNGIKLQCLKAFQELHAQQA